SSLNATLTLSQFVGLTTHPTVDGLTYGGTQDNGTQVRLAGGSGWREFAEGDGGHPVIVLTPSAINSPATVFSTYVYGSIRRWALNTGNGLPSFDNFSTSNATFCEGTSGQRIAFYPPFTGNGVDQTIYFGTYKLFISNNLGTTWTPGISGGCSAPDLTRGGSDVLSAIGVERKANAQVIYTASAQGRVMITKDGGASFTDITNGLPTRFPESITVNPSNAAIAYITFSGYGTGHVFRTTDFGQTWSNIGGTVGLPTSIPNVPANALLIDPVTPTTLYVGTDIGVFRSTDNGATWATFNNGMLPTVVTGFAVTAGGTIQLSTYGRGMFELTNSLVVCSYAVDPLSPQNFTSAGGAGSFNITTGVNCAWTATSLAPWITVTNGSGMGSGVVNYTVAPNTGGARNGQILHTSDSFYTIGQAAAPVVATTLQFSLPTYQFNEGDGRATITVTRGGDTSNPVSVNLSTVDDPASVACATNNGTAYARCDYATTVETVTFAAGDSQPKNVTIPLIDDSYAEGTEAVQLRLSNPSGATLGTQATATLNITSNDAAGAANPINTTPFFVRMQYLDFLSREPEAGEPWSAILNGCPNAFNTDPFSASAGCDRNIVSSSFFGSPEFRLKGFYVFNFYRVAFNRLPEYAEIIPDMRSVTGQTSAEVYAKRAAFPVNFTQRPDFRAAYDAFSNADFVNTLMDRYTLQQIMTPDPQNPESGTKVTLARLDLLNQLAAGTLTRAKVLRAIVESDEVGVRERNRAFVAMQYYGYLRRTPETDGFNNWLNYLNAHPTDSRTMVDGFMNAVEYRLRFGQ
ncbi:MAG TPA: Calx-beta domain-containing protein, partial [Pyrinomonadaceae bacterium]|nr:Calx-beta domain-containing protein [Pyrinomonadaceae bacterium]